MTIFYGAVQEMTPRAVYVRRPLGRGPQRVAADHGRLRLRGDDPKQLPQVVERSRQRSAVCEMVTNGVPLAVDVDADAD